ncbi:MAG: hypothetical protein ACYC0V_21930, partial [Armatimonadota bacterium]
FFANVLTHIANIIIQRQQDPLAQRIMLQISKFLVRSWERDKLHKRERNYEAEAILRKQLTCFMASCDKHAVLVLWEPFIKSLPIHAHEVIDVFKDLIYA